MRKAIPFSLLVVLLGLLVLQVGCGSDEEDPVTPAPKCSIEMTAPVAGQSFTTDQSISIRWKRGTTENVSIQLYKGANAVGIIRADHTNTGTDGFYSWLNPETFGQGSGDDYSIKVTSLSDPDCTDQTGQFSITDVSNCSVQFAWAGQDTIPAAVAGQDYEIRWNSENTTGFVRIELWWDPPAVSDELVGVISDRTADTGSLIWSARSFNRGTGDRYRFKIMDFDYNGCMDLSDTFNITDENTCSIEVLGIGDGFTYRPGQVVPISFSFENSSSVVKLKLFSGNEQVNAAPRYGVITNSFDTENGILEYDWVVSDLDHGGPSFSAFNIRAYDVDDEYCVGRSETFSIQQ